MPLESCPVSATIIESEKISFPYGLLSKQLHDEGYIDPCEEVMPSAPVFSELDDTMIPIEYPALKSVELPEHEITETLERPETAINSEVKALYDNILLDNLESCTQQFLNTVPKTFDGFELYELLYSYLRANNQLSVCEKSLSSLHDQFDSSEKQVWAVSFKKTSKTGVCEDDVSLVGTHQYSVAKFNDDAFNKLRKTLTEMKELVKDSFSLYTYSAELCSVQIWHFFHKSFGHLNVQSFDVQCFSSYPTHTAEHSANLLRLCISTLFSFIRKPSLPNNFLQDCQRWLSQCIGMLLRLATVTDHFFILNHLVRCPPGTISKWAAELIQVPQIPPFEYNSSFQGISSFSHLGLDYALCLLSIILSPIVKKSDFLSHCNPSTDRYGTADGDSSLQWVVVDSDGEDDPDDPSLFKEGDIIALLNQVK